MSRIGEIRDYVRSLIANPDDGILIDAGCVQGYAKRIPTLDEFKMRVSGEVRGEFCTVNLFDGKEHNYLELGGWIGEQRDALWLMILGERVGAWKILSPITILGLAADSDLCSHMMGMGFFSIQSTKEEEE